MSSTVGAARPALAVAEGAAADGRVVARQLAAVMGLALVVLLIGAALWLVARRLSGAFSLPLGGMAIVGAAVIVELAAWAVRRLAGCTQYLVLSTQYRDKLTTTISFLVSVAAIAILGSLTLAGTPAFAIALAWLVLVGAEAAAWVPQVRANWRRNELERPATATEAEIPAGLVQQLSRVRDGDRESIHVVAQVEIAAGDQVGAVHMAFCPPLDGRPELTAHAMDAEDVDVRVTQAESFGGAGGGPRGASPRGGAERDD